MGMYDSIYLKAKCPYCGEVSEIEFQTKDTSCTLHIWRVGDFVDGQLKQLNTIADCRSKKCRQAEDNKVGYVSGFGSMFDAIVFLKRGVITGKFKITELLNKDWNPERIDKQKP